MKFKKFKRFNESGSLPEFCVDPSYVVGLLENAIKRLRKYNDKDSVVVLEETDKGLRGSVVLQIKPLGYFDLENITSGDQMYNRELAIEDFGE